MAQAGNIVANLQLKITEFSQGIQQASQQLSTMQNAANQTTAVMKKAFMGVSVAIAAVGAASVAMAVENENAMAKMEAATGATKAEMEGFSQAADNLFAAGRGNYQEIYGALTQVKQQLGLTGDEAEAAANSALIYSQTFGADIVEAIGAASTAQKVFGADSTQAFDIFTRMSQQAGDKAGDLLATFNEYAPTLKDVGWGFEDMSATMLAGMEAGSFNFDAMADGMKEFKILMTDGNKNTQEWVTKLLGSKQAASDFFAGVANGTISGQQAFATLTGKIGELDSKADQMQAGVAIMGTKWEDLGTDVGLAMGAAGASLDGFNGATANAGAALDATLGAKVTRIKNEFLLWAKDMGQQLMPTLKAIADWVIANMPAIQATMTTVFTAIFTVLTTVANVLGEVFQFIQDNSTAFKLLGAIITGILIPSILGFILNAIRMNTVALLGMIMNTLRLIAANYALGLSFLAANIPLLLIIVGIGLLVAAIIWLVKHWDTVRAVTLSTWEAIKSGLSAAWEWVKVQFQAFLEWIKNVWNTSWTAIKNFFVSTWEGLKAVGHAIWNSIVAAAKAIWDGLKAYFVFVFTFYKTLFTTIWNGIKAAAIAIWNGLKSAAIAVFNALKTFFLTILNFYKSIFTTAWNAIRTVLVSLWNGLKSSAISIWNAVASRLGAIVNGIRSTMSSIFNSIKSTVVNVWNSIRSAISSAIDSVRSKVSDGASFLRNTFTSAVSAVKGAFSGMWSSIRQSLQNVVDGIRSKVMKAKEWLTELNPFKRHSPSLVDNVLAGSKIIKDTYEGLGGMRIAPPQIGNLSSGRVDVDEAFGGVEGGGNGGSTYNAPLIQVENMNVRDEQDVRNVSRELFGLQRSHDRAKGGR